SDHLHILVSIPPNIAVSEFVQRAKGRTSRRIQQEFPELKKRYWGKHFCGRGYFSTTSGHITDEVINEYINNHTEAHKPTSSSNIRLDKLYLKLYGPPGSYHQPPGSHPVVV
ncbi:MAG: IS200/IS605 family transposase, partial [Rickettsia endosymbiont of Bryobia graminum]|nr:IS200/IS605 family transposase [Rickettsia endosymbiont of Bryobia graminum]